MASTLSQVNFPNAEDISQKSFTQTNTLDAAGDMQYGDSCDTVKKEDKRPKEQGTQSYSPTEQSNNANEINMAEPVNVNKSDTGENKPKQNELQEANEKLNTEPVQRTEEFSSDQVNYCFESDSDEDFCVLRRSRSDELLELKHHFQAKENTDAMTDFPSPLSEINAKEYLELQKDYARKNIEEGMASPEQAGYPYGACSSSPGEFSEEGERYARRRNESGGSACEERIRSIEDEYIRRISTLEERHFELEDVLARLTSSLEPLFEGSAVEDDKIDVAELLGDVEDDDSEVNKETKAKIEKLMLKTEQQKKKFARIIGLELFLEFQQKIRSFAMELNGVLNCSEAAIRHARVVQEWGSSVQLMFEDMKDERMRMQEFIDERERSVLILRNQFASELQQQGRTLMGLVEDMKSYRDLAMTAEKYGGSSESKAPKMHLAKDIVDFLLKQRVDGEKALILDLKKQSKISEMKLMIIHQQSFIQQVQEQNRELRAIIEGLMGPEDYSMDLNDSEPSSTPASATSPERGSLRQSLDRLTDKSVETPVCKISDVLDCDRGETYPGVSTDGDIATVQTYGIGKDTKNIEPGSPLVYDPLTISYIRDQCRAVEETERQHHNNLFEQVNENKENIETNEDGVPTFGDGVECINIEPYLRKTAESVKHAEPTKEDESESALVGDMEAGSDVTDALIKNKASPVKEDVDELEDEYSEQLDLEDIDYVVDEGGLVDDIPVAEPPIVDIENTNNNDDLE